MPAVTLVVCVHRQRNLLERLIRESQDCYDELLVLHDIPDVEDVRTLVESVGGRFFERTPSFLQEPHWPFAWGEAKHDWIFRLDADEFPSGEMKEWLRTFRKSPEPPKDLSGFTCIWPLWDGSRAVSRKWPAGRLFLFNKQRVRFFGMCEQSPIPDGQCQAPDLVLHHQPPGRKGYGVYNMLFRPQSKRGAAFIAKCLSGKPTDLACWRWTDEEWPMPWREIKRHPFQAAAKQITLGSFRCLRDQWQKEKRLFPIIALTSQLHVALTCLEVWRRGVSAKRSLAKFRCS